MNQEFRMRAPALYSKTPDYSRIDEWLFLMQHNGLWTRLLDWTTGSLIALFFAINQVAYTENDDKFIPIVWMLNPIALNFFTEGRLFFPISYDDSSYVYSSCDVDYYTYQGNSNEAPVAIEKCHTNILAAWGKGKCNFEKEYPVALKPQHVHQRVTAQKGCFLVFGGNDDGLQNMFINKKIKNILNFDFNNTRTIYNNTDEKKEFIKRLNFDSEINDLLILNYKINPDKKVLQDIIKELHTAGIGNSTIMPDLEGLSSELIMKYARE